MSVSYISQPYKPNPYVLPIDLGVMERVLSVKQKQFDIGAQQFQNEIDQMGNLDVIKDEDRNYLNQKINNLVTSVNDFGGINFSDANILNQIEGLGGDIYTDNKVINAVASTKSIRNLVNSYNEYKTNPKLSKLYSPANEAYDMQAVNSYLSDGQIGSSYRGPNSATPYTPYRENHMKLFDKLKADLVESLDDKGLFILKETKERVTPERIMSMAADLLTPDERDQMKRDAVYLYKINGQASPEFLVNKSLEQYYGKVKEAEDSVKEYQNLAASAADDYPARNNYLKLADQAKDNLKSLKGMEAGVATSAVNAYKTNPEELMYQVYSNDYFRGLGSRYSVNRVTRDIIPDQAEIFQRREAQSQNQFDERMALEHEKLSVEAQKNGLYRNVDPATGKVTYIPLLGNDGLSSTNINTENPDNLKVNEKSLTDMNNNLMMQKDQIYNDLWSGIIADRPDLGFDQPTITAGGIQRIFKGQQFLEGVNNRPGLQMEDLAGLKSNAVRGQLQKAGLNSKQLEFLDRLYKNYEAMVLGKGEGVPNLPDGVADAFEKAKMLDEEIRANNFKIQSVNEAVAQEAGITQQELQKYRDYKNSKIGENVDYSAALSYGTIREGSSPEIENIQRKIANSNIDVDKLTKQYYNALGSRDVYNTKLFNSADPLVKSGQVSKLVFDNIVNGKGTPLRDSPEISQEDLKSSSINPIQAGMSADGSGSFYIDAEIQSGRADKQKTSIYRIQISDDNANKLGLYRDRYEALNYSVNLTGRSGDIPVYGNKKLAITLNVSKSNTNSLNGSGYKAQAKFYNLDADGNKTGSYQLVNIPNTQGRSASEAYDWAKKAVVEAANAGATFQDFKDYLINHNQ